MTGPMRKLMLECTTTYRHDYRTGIPRVVRNVVRHMRPLAAARGYELVPVHFASGGLYRAALTASGELAAQPKGWRRQVRDFGRRGIERVAPALPEGRVRDWLVAPGSEPGLARVVKRVAALTRMKGRKPRAGEIEILPGDRLFLIDVSLGFDMRDKLRDLDRAGVPIGALIYDLIPLQHPQWWPPGFSAAFAAWLAPILEHASRLVAISSSVAADVDGYRRGLPAGRVRAGQEVAWFHLGHDLDPIAADAPIRPRIAALFADEPVLLNVGWLDPRKNQLRLFDALKEVLASGTAVRLLLVGKCGVGGGPILERVERDPVLSQHVTILNDLSDAELRYAFRHARALVYPSLAEGFGLPLVEALSLGLPSFASDLPVFRETSEGYAVFFDPLDPHMIASQLIEFLRDGRYPAARPQQQFRWATWDQSIAVLLDRMLADEPTRVP